MTRSDLATQRRFQEQIAGANALLQEELFEVHGAQSSLMQGLDTERQQHQATLAELNRLHQ
ncbi:hypothetical protein EMCG_05070 [[Emmonsia] crescens]|uniref:Uncharacterized protein n=1 Tax=[Emmonsia] crescens TaxID=73230 RepID=A0A0G2HQ72_9EURO|nr:hypothetical protein EMCG_05070 [Emmonsia crescens UAMH 3008]